MTDSQQDIEPTLGEQISDLYGRVAKLNDQMAAVLSPEWGARMGLIPAGHLLHPGPGPEEQEEQAAPIDWQAIVRDRERELKQVGEARHHAETAVARVRALSDRWSLTPLDHGERILHRELHAALDGPVPEEMDTTQPEPAPAGLREQIAAAIWERQNPGRRYADCEYRWQADAEADADAVLAVILPATRITASIARDAEATVQRVIDLYERWVKAGPPLLGTSVSRWWDTRLAELRAALEPPKTDQP